MLHLEKSKFDPRNVKEFPIHTTVEEFTEGQGVAGVWEDGLLVCKPSSATANEIFLGIALSRLSYPTKEIVVETVVAVLTTATLSYAPVAPSTDMKLYNVTESLALTYGSASNDGEYSVSSATVTLHSGESGDTLLATYKRALTVAEAEVKYFKSGDLATREAASVTRTLSLIRRGVVYTDQVNTSDNWGGYAANSQIISTASGILTLQGVSGGKVMGKAIEAPSAASPWVGIEFDAVNSF